MKKGKEEEEEEEEERKEETLRSHCSVVTAKLGENFAILAQIAFIKKRVRNVQGQKGKEKKKKKKKKKRGISTGQRLEKAG